MFNWTVDEVATARERERKRASTRERERECVCVRECETEREIEKTRIEERRRKKRTSLNYVKKLICNLLANAISYYIATNGNNIFHSSDKAIVVICSRLRAKISFQVTVRIVQYGEGKQRVSI